MIEPTINDIGRFVVYVDHAGTTAEAGRITSFNEQTVFVAFPKRLIAETTVQGCERSMLHWLDDIVQEGTAVKRPLLP